MRPLPAHIPVQQSGRTPNCCARIVGKDLIAIAADQASELIPLSLTKIQHSRHFPEYDEEARERARLAALALKDGYLSCDHGLET